MRWVYLTILRDVNSTLTIYTNPHRFSISVTFQLCAGAKVFILNLKRDRFFVNILCQDVDFNVSADGVRFQLGPSKFKDIWKEKKKRK